jgi:hypothetical protein
VWKRSISAIASGKRIGAGSDFVASRGIRHAEVEGCRVVLDLRRETYRVLDQVGSALWLILTGQAAKAAVFDELAGQYAVDAARLEADLAAFANQCLAEELLERADGSSRPVEPPPSGLVDSGLGARGAAGIFGAWRSLLGTRRAISRDGFRVTYERYALLSVGRARVPFRGALTTFRRAENFFVFRRAPDDCLARSLALYRFLREAGHPAEHVIGVRRFPFQAHAWVECEGAGALDDRAPAFTPLTRLAAR